MEDARKWWDSKKVELQKNIDKLLDSSAACEKEVLTIMMDMVNKVKVKED